jgi:hypothetical protein
LFIMAPAAKSASRLIAVLGAERNGDVA